MRNIEKILSAAGIKLFKGFIVERDIDPNEIDHSSIKNILIVIRHQMGDMLCSLPMMCSVRKFYPSAHITLVTKKSTCFEDIFKDNNSPVDEVKYYEHGAESLLNLAKELKDKRIDLAIVPSSVNFSSTNHFIAHFCEAKYKAGVRSRDYEPNPVSYLLNVKNDFLWDSKKVHQVERNLDVIRQLNITADISEIHLTLREENIKFADDFLKQHFPAGSKIAGFHAGAGKAGNIWQQEKFAELAAMLYNKYNCSFFLSEGPMDEKYVAALTSILKTKNIPFAVHKGDLMNNTAIISKLDLLVTNDTGVMHLAAGFKTPLVALFGPTNAWEWGPLGKEKLSIQSKNNNINNIEAATVFETCIRLLSVKNLNN